MSKHRKGFIESAELLLRARAEPQLVCQSGKNALHMAAQHGHGRLCELLVAWDPSLLVFRTAKGLTSADLAREAGW